MGPDLNGQIDRQERIFNRILSLEYDNNSHEYSYCYDWFCCNNYDHIFVSAITVITAITINTMMAFLALEINIIVVEIIPVSEFYH